MTRALSFAFGLLMVAAGAVQGDGPALLATGVAVASVLVGLLVRAAATLAVLATVVAFAVSDPAPVVAALAGLAAVGYLALRHATGQEPALTVPTVLGAAGLCAAAMLGAVIPAGLPWIPLAAPPLVIAIYLVVVDQYAH
ncbi:MAG: hypothetical protein ABW137_17620 [Mycobacterium sp.]